MQSRAVEVVVAGQKVKVVSSASAVELQELASAVTEKVSAVSPRGRPSTPQAIALAALALAHELDVERRKRQALERKTRDTLRRLLVRVDQAIESTGPEK
jgi:cell division protein ZapA